MKLTLQTSVTVFGRLYAVRGFTIFALLVAATPILVTIAARQAYLRVERPDVGLDLDADLGVEARDGRWSGVQQRDRIVALDGVKLRDPADWMTRALDGGPRPLAVTFARNGELFTLTAASRPLAAIDRVAVFARVVTAAVLMIMGLLVFVARPGAAVTWLMLLLTWDLGAFLLVKVVFWPDPRLVKEAGVFPWTIATSVGLHLLTYFPARIPWFDRRPWRSVMLYAPVFAAPFIQSFHLVTRASSVGAALTAAVTVAVVWVVAAQHRRARRSTDARSRSQYRALLVGFAVGLAVPAGWNWLRLALDVWNSPWNAHYNSLPLVVFAGVTANAIVRHNALEIDRFTAAVVGYALTTILVGGVFAAALVGIPLALGTSVGESPSLLVLTTALTFAGFSPVYRLIKRWVDRRFFREQAGASQMADALHDLVLGMQGSREDALSAAFASASILSGETVEVWLLDLESNELRMDRRVGAGRDSAPLALAGPLGQALAAGASGGVVDLAPRPLESSAQDELRARELAMVASVTVHGVVAGCFAIGRKRSGAGYTLEELSLLTIIGAQLGAAFERTASETQIDRYHLEKRLGTGGMAEVFLAWQLGPGGFERKVALKRPLPHVSEDPNAVAAFLDEARLAAQLVHPHIARVYDVGERKGSYYLVMEYVDGPSLRAVLRELERKKLVMPVAIAASIIIDVLAALDHAHNALDERDRRLELVHRDVSPRNILMNRLAQPKLVDFGIARAQFQLHVTRTGIVKGTLPYMSPEQASDFPLDHRADVYSAAVVLYELLTNRVAYPKGPRTRNQPASRPPVASSVASAVPVALDGVLRRATETGAHERFATAAELGAAIRDAIRPLEPATSDLVVAFLRSTVPNLMGLDRSPSEQTESELSGQRTLVEGPTIRPATE